MWGYSEKLAVYKPGTVPSLETYPDGPASRAPSLQNYERKQFCCLSCPACDDLLWQPGHSNQSLLLRISVWEPGGVQMQIYLTGLRLSAWILLPFHSVIQSYGTMWKLPEVCDTRRHNIAYYRLTGPTSALQITKRCWEKFHSKGKYSWPWATWKLICI